MGVNLGWFVLPVATQVAWRMLSLSQQKGSPASLHLCISQMGLYLQKRDGIGINHRSEAVSVTLAGSPSWGAGVELCRNRDRRGEMGLLCFPSPPFSACEQDMILRCVCV